VTHCFDWISLGLAVVPWHRHPRPLRRT